MPQNPALPSYNALYAFGDSLSDAGNLSLPTTLTGTTPVSPPYFSQRYGLVSGNVFSNGPTWVQNLSLDLNLGTLSPSLTGGNDFAYGGAETGPTPHGGLAVQAISLPSQLAQFEASGARSVALSLFTVSIGSNDLLDILANTGLSAQQQAADVAAAAANTIGFIRRLAADGAKTVLVLAVPDLGKTPDVLRGIANGTGTPSAALTAVASQLAQTYNAAVATQLAGIAGLTAGILDTYKLIDTAVANPAAYGLSNVTSPVWSGNYTSAGSGTLAAVGAAAQNQYLFFDNLHPTETGHQAITTLAEQQLVGGAAAPQIVQYYSNILQRAPDLGGLGYWGGQVTRGAQTVAQVDAQFAASPESQATVVPIVELYTLLGRTPDAAGLAGWVHLLAGGTSLDVAAGGFLTSPEAVRLYGMPGPSPAANTAFINTAYQALLGRAADTAGAQYWLSHLNAGVEAPGQVVANFIRSPELQARDAAPVASFLVAAGNGTAAYGGSLFLAG